MTTAYNSVDLIPQMCQFEVRFHEVIAFTAFAVSGPRSIPVEYVMNTANGNVGNNFDARAGLAITVPKKHRSDQ
jgi:hypothetical protein